MAIAVCAAKGPGIIWARAMEVIGTLIDAVAVVDQVFAHIPHERGAELDGAELEEVQHQLPQTEGVCCDRGVLCHSCPSSMQ